MWLEAVYKSENNEKKCPTCGGCVQERVHGEMYAGSFIQNGERLEIRRIPSEFYNDPIILDPITQYFNGGLYKSWASEPYYSRGGKKLHRHVWEVAFGEIPKNCHIHHKDHQKTNNSLANLECLDAKEHLSENWHETKHTRPNNFSDEARRKAIEALQTPEARLRQSHAIIRAQSWTKWKREKRNCLVCNIEFDGLIRKSGNAQKYCTSKCRSLYRIT